MNYCPDCGAGTETYAESPDVATVHYYDVCTRGHRWEVTVDKAGNLLHIAPVEKEVEEEV